MKTKKVIKKEDPDPIRKGQAAMEVLIIIGVMVIGVIIFGTFYFSNIGEKVVGVAGGTGDTNPENIVENSYDRSLIYDGVEQTSTPGGTSHIGGSGGSGDTSTGDELDCSTCSCTDSECNLNCSKCNTAGDLCSTITNPSLCTNENHCACEAVCIQNTTFWNTYCAAPICIVDGECDTDNGETIENCSQDCLSVVIVSPIVPNGEPFVFTAHTPFFLSAKIVDKSGNRMSSELESQYTYTWAVDFGDGNPETNLITGNNVWYDGSFVSGDISVTATKGAITLTSNDSVPVVITNPTAAIFFEESNGGKITPARDYMFRDGSLIQFMPPTIMEYGSLISGCNWYYVNLDNNASGVFHQNTTCNSFKYSGLPLGKNLIYVQAKAKDGTKTILDTRMTEITIVEIPIETILVFDTTATSTGSSADNQVSLPLESTGTYNFDVFWGDGTSNHITSYNQPEVTHTYAEPEEYQVKITGTIIGFKFNDTGDKSKLLEISQWGPLRLGNNGSYFRGCNNLQITATDILDTTGTRDMSYAFANTEITTVPNMNYWDMTSVTSMAYMFSNATNFNQKIGDWNTSSVTTMAGMFYMVQSFNQEIGNWNTSNVRNMSGMFNEAGFNKPINLWNTYSVTNMSEMFSRAFNFNQDIHNWDVSHVTSWSDIFFECPIQEYYKPSRFV